jgi:hypothetical protein
MVLLDKSQAGTYIACMRDDSEDRITTFIECGGEMSIRMSLARDEDAVFIEFISPLVCTDVCLMVEEAIKMRDWIRDNVNEWRPREVV